jgi:hypothetical protein
VPRTDVQHSRCRLRIVCVWHGRNGQYMTARRHSVIVTSSLHNIGDRSAVDLKIENYVPSKVRNSHNDQTPTRLSCGSSDRGCANKNKNQKKSGEGSKSWVHAPDATLWTRFRRARRSSPCEVLGGCPDAPRPSRPPKLPQFPRGQAHTGWAEKNEIRIPHRSIYISHPRLHVHC